MSVRPAAIVLADGTTFEGEAIGADLPDGLATGEFVFNTVMTGYQEVISDPSYAGQVITFTSTHIGNYGVVPTDDEAPAVHCAGVVVRDLARRRSNHRSTGDLDAYLRSHGVGGVAGVDTRRLTRHLRDHGAMPGAFGTAAENDLRAAAGAALGTDGRDLVATVTTAQPVVHAAAPGAGRRIVAVDLGIKATIVRQLVTLGEVHVVPAATSAEDILALQPDGVFLSNGPGDPGAVATVPGTVAALIGNVPIFGICMGHQMLATALGGATHKLPFGHHGGNHPVRDEATGRVEITSQNHNYCVDPDSLERIEVTHVNLNDGTLEGFRSLDAPAFGIQYHPEAGPGPHESRYLFGRFAELMDSRS